MSSTMQKCKVCGNEMASSAKQCPKCGAKNSKSIYKKWWFWLIIVVFIAIIAGNSNSGNNAGKNVANDNIQDIQETTAEENKSSVDVSEKEDNKVPTEYKSALKKAKTYSDMMHMSKKGIYNQLTSEYGEKFSAEAAQYAIDNLDADWNKNALEKAKSYQKTMNMSPAKIYDQLISEYGEKFTAEEAQYAIDHLE